MQYRDFQLSILTHIEQKERERSVDSISCVRHADIPGASVINQLVHAKRSLGENIRAVSSVFHGDYLPI